ncbi:hypothetical protein KAR91_34750 [Candidatus Pacearchaeota archaeon]|nr:hypothetical protein [Candidatus Pacearchaeota archaeon]
MNDLLCDRCDKNMTDEHGNSTIGCQLELRVETGDRDLVEHYEKQLGKYRLNRIYHFCWECWLDSLMRAKDD